MINEAEDNLLSPEAENSAESEVFEKVELRIEPPNGLRQWRFEYESGSLGTCVAYNNAILRIAQEANLGPFHQSGQEFSTGWHQWEFWQPTDRAQLEDLAQKVQQLAPENFAQASALKLHEYYKLMARRH